MGVCSRSLQSAMVFSESPVSWDMAMLDSPFMLRRNMSRTKVMRAIFFSARTLSVRMFRYFLQGEHFHIS